MTNYDYDIKQIRDELTIEQIFDLLSEFHGEPRINNDTIISKTICHNSISELNHASHKLYYYNNTKLFHCYTGCPEQTYDIFELARKVKSMETGTEWSLPKAVHFVATYFGYSPKVLNFEDEENNSISDYWNILNAYDRIKTIDKEKKIIELKTYDAAVLQNLPRPRIAPWEAEGITKEICDTHNICYNPKSCGIVIPHYDINNNLIGIRERTLIQENAELYGKYHPAKINGIMYNHPLSFAVYNLNWSKDNIRRMKKVIIFESEKSCLQFGSAFGQDNDISVAVCGSSLINYQLDLLLSLGVNEIIVAFDHDFNDIKEDNAKKLIDKYKKMYIKYGNKITLSFIWDKDGILPYKASPTDLGKDVFLKLFNNRINLYS